MKRIFLLVAALLLVAGPASSGSLTLLGAGKPPSVTGYQGPGDIVAGAVEFYSCRAYSAATAGTKAYRLVRASDSTQTDINSLANGLCDTTTPATFCNATTCKYVTIYDQTASGNCSGSCDVTQGTDLIRPTWSASTLNGWPCATDLSVGTSYLASAGSMSQAAPYTFVGLANQQGSSQGGIIGWDSFGGLIYSATGGTVILYAGSSPTAAATFNAYHVIIGSVPASGNSALVVDGSASSVAAGNTTASGTSGFLGAPGSLLTGGVCEGIMYPIALNATQYGNINSNMHGATNGWNF